MAPPALDAADADPTLGVHDISLEDFVRDVSDMIAGGWPDPKDTAALHPLLQLILAGQMKTDNGDLERLALNIAYDHQRARANDLELCRDYDSMLGLTRSLPFTVAFAQMHIPNHAFHSDYRNNTHLSRTFPFPALPPGRDLQEVCVVFSTLLR